LLLTVKTGTSEPDSFVAADDGPTIRRFTFQVPPEDSGQRLDRFLAARLGWLSRMRVAELIGRGACVVNGQVAPAGYHLTTGETVEVAVDFSVPTAMTPEAIPLDILHEDDHLIVIVKPAGMLVHPTRGVKTGTLANALAYHLNRSRVESEDAQCGPIVRPGIVHRLDRATSGLIVVAKTQRALSVLSRHFCRRLVFKSYLALVSGEVEGDAITIAAPIGRDPERRPRWCVMEGGRNAETRLRVKERLGEATLVELEPVTGRTNQLRIHCAHIGHPIVGDDLFGKGANQTVQTRFERLCLHAWRLGFHHPAGGEWLEFTSPLPLDLATLAARMVKR
jgi:23S rRNA pseudouridine1911/1915/1917 synthase